MLAKVFSLLETDTSNHCCLTLDDPGVRHTEWRFFGITQSALIHHDVLDYFDGQQNVGPGFLANLIRGKSQLPETFETRKQNRDREATEAKRRQLQAEQSRLERAYADFQEAESKHYIAEQLSAEEFELLLSQHKKKLTDQYTFWRDPQHAAEVERLAKIGVRNEIAQRLTLPTFEEFVRRQKTAPQKPAAAPWTSEPNTQS